MKKLVYEDVVFDKHKKTGVCPPWAMICTKCNEIYFENAGQGFTVIEKLEIKEQCMVEGCTNQGAFYLTLVGAK